MGLQKIQHLHARLLEGLPSYVPGKSKGETDQKEIKTKEARAH